MASLWHSKRVNSNFLKPRKATIAMGVTPKPDDTGLKFWKKKFINKRRVERTPPAIKLYLVANQKRETEKEREGRKEETNKQT